MWKLIKLELTYHRKLILWSYGLAAVFVKILIQAPPDQGDVAVEPVLWILGLFAPYIVVVSSIMASNRHENRLLLHGMLPMGRDEVALARVLSTALVSLLGLALALIFLALLPLVGQEAPTISVLLMVNGLALLLGQGLLLSEEGRMRRETRHKLWHIWPLVLAGVVFLPLQYENEPFPIAWNRVVHSDLKLAMVYLLIPAVALLNMTLFRRRRDLTC